MSSFTNIYEVLLLSAMGAMARHRVSIMTQVLVCTHTTPMSIYYLRSTISLFTNSYEVLLLSAMAQHRVSIMTKVLVCTHGYISFKINQ